MEYRLLGPTGLKVSVISYGAWMLPFDGDKKGTEAKHTEDTVKKALELGINFFDTAERYGWG